MYIKIFFIKYSVTDMIPLPVPVCASVFVMAQ